MSPDLPILFPYSFFFYCYGDHRDLHSFPTRRSSDLHRVVAVVDLDRVVARRAEHDDADVDRLAGGVAHHRREQDRKSTRLNSSHPSISYAVFCLKKKKKKKKNKTEVRTKE